MRAGTYSKKTNEFYVAAAYLRLIGKPVPAPNKQKKPSAAKTGNTSKKQKKPPAAKTGNASKKQKKTSAPKSKKQKSSVPKMLPPSMLDPFGSVGDAPQPILALPLLDDQQSTNDGQEKESDEVEV